MGGPDAASDRFLGRVLDGRYAIEARLGEGGLGVVYRAKQTRLGRLVAVKVLHAEHAETAQLRKRFEREARSLGTLVHPNIVQVIDYGLEEGSPFLVMELLEGRPLNDAIRAGIGLDRAWEIGRTMVSAVAYAHARRIVHRDLKPANVFLQQGPDGKEVTRVLDFGLAKSVGDDGDATVLTKAGSIMGTPAYMSPEQATGAATDERSDVYSLGIVLFELLTGQRPFQGPPVELLRMHLVAELPTLGSARPGIPNAEAIDAVLRRATAKEVGERYADAGELLAALDAVQQRAEARASGIGERAPDMSLEATVVGEPTGAMPLGRGVTTQHVRSEVHPPSPGGLRRPGALVAAAALVVLGVAGAAAAFAGGEDEPSASEDAASTASDTAEEVLAAQGPASPPEPPPYGRCDGTPPSAVVLARLAPGSPIPSARELRSSLSGLPPEAIIVHRLSGPTDAVAERSVTLELSRASFPEWTRLATGSSEETCRQVAGAISARVGRPVAPLDFYARREPNIRAEPIGTLASLDPQALDASVLDWLEPPATTTRCTYEPQYGEGAFFVTCGVTNPRRATARFEIVPIVYQNGAGQRVYQEQLVLAPGERIERRYQVRAYSEQDIGSCACEVTSAR